MLRVVFAAILALWGLFLILGAVLVRDRPRIAAVLAGLGLVQTSAMTAECLAIMHWPTWSLAMGATIETALFAVQLVGSVIVSRNYDEASARRLRSRQRHQ